MIDSGPARRRRLATPDWQRGATNMRRHVECVCGGMKQSGESCRRENVYVNTVYNCVDDSCSHPIT